MNIRDPKFTARLEPALSVLAKQPTRPLAYLTSRFDLESGDLAMWLGEFNGGRKELALARIAEVKDQLTNVGASSARAAPAAPPPVKPAGIPPVKLAPTSDVGKWLEAQRVKIVGRVNSFQVEVTPALAESWLRLNVGNRKPSQAKIRRFAQAMKTHHWELNGETVKFSLTGRLIDGQSRLMALVGAGVPIVMEIRAGLPDVAQQSMDSGEIRKNVHTLQMMGEANHGILAPALRLVHHWQLGILGGKTNFRISDVLENGAVSPLLEKHEGLKAAVGWSVSDGLKAKLLMPLSEAAFFHYACGCADATLRDHFFEALIEGVGLTKLSPVYHLRERLLAARAGSNPVTQVERRALFIKAWKHAVAGDKITQLRHVMRGSAAEKFPEFPATTAT